MCQKLCTYVLPGGGRYAGASAYPAMSRLPYPGPGVKAVERKCLEMERYVTSAESPCRGCCLVADPESCNHENCRLWQQWFLERWEGLRQRVSQQYQQAPLEEVGSLIGGRRYVPPHRRREFLAADPCRSCGCPKPLCREDCRYRRLWLEGKMEVDQ